MYQLCTCIVIFQPPTYSIVSIFYSQGGNRQSRHTSAPVVGSRTGSASSGYHSRTPSAGFSRTAGNPMITRDDRGPIGVTSSKVVSTVLTKILFILDFMSNIIYEQRLLLYFVDNTLIIFCVNHTAG